VGKVEDIQIGNKKIGEGHPTFVIAEMACGHEGKLDLAKKMIKITATANADAIKFHMESTEDYIVPQHEDYEISKKLQFTRKEWKELFQLARKNKLLKISMPNDVPSVQIAKENMSDGYYIHSANLSDEPLVKEIAKLRKPIFVGTGASALEEIEKAIKIIKSFGNKKIILMHGFQAYPTKIEDTHLKFLKRLKEKFNLHVGFADHVDGESELCSIVPLLAIPYGAVVLEKHFTIDRKLKLVDYQSAMNPDEFKNFIRNLRFIEKALGTYGPHKLSEDELNYRKRVKKNIVAAIDIKKGEKITEKMIAFKRSKPGISPLEVKKVVGKIARRDILKNENIRWEMLE
jgi:sialic acid synthase SpsE